MFGRKPKEPKVKPPAKDAKKDGAKENPYIEHNERQDDRYMNLAVDKYNWQVAFRITAGLLAISMGFNGYYMTQSKFIPVPIAMDEIGHMVVVGPADKARPIDSKRVLRTEAIEWIESARIIVGDQLAQKKFMNRVYARVPATGKARGALDEFYRERRPFSTAATETTAAEVTLALPTSPDTWQIEWTETWRNHAGDVTRRERWKAVMTIEVSPLDTEDGIRANPAGFFVTAFNWSKQI